MSNKMDRIPANILKLADDGEKKNSLDTLVDYLSAEEGAILLSDKQQQLLERIEKADALFSTNKYTQKEIAKIMADHFSQSISQSRKDIEAAEYVMGTAKRFNKRAKLTRHIDRIEDLIIKLLREGRYELAKGFIDSYTKAIAEMPEDKSGSTAPGMIIMNFNHNIHNQMTDTPIGEEKAFEIARKRLADQGVNIEEVSRD